MIRALFVTCLILVPALVAACDSTPVPALIPTELPPSEPLPSQPTSSPPLPTLQPVTQPPPTATPAPKTAEPEPETDLATEVIGIPWKWEAFNDAGETHIPVEDPDRYTLQLLPDGQALIQADCNSMSWTYTLDGERLTFEPLGATTLASCGEGSRDQEYLAYLGQVVSYLVNQDRLFLDLQDETGNMVFLGDPTAAAPSVTGRAVVEGDPTLPEGALLEAWIEHVTQAGAPISRVGEQAQEITSLPADFSVPYDPQLIQPDHTYRLIVRVIDTEGNLLYANTQPYYVLTQGHPASDLEVLLQRIRLLDPHGG